MGAWELGGIAKALKLIGNLKQHILPSFINVCHTNLTQYEITFLIVFRQSMPCLHVCINQANSRHMVTAIDFTNNPLTITTVTIVSKPQSIGVLLKTYLHHSVSTTAWNHYQQQLRFLVRLCTVPCNMTPDKSAALYVNLIHTTEITI